MPARLAFDAVRRQEKCFARGDGFRAVAAFKDRPGPTKARPAGLGDPFAHAVLNLERR
jgi:hypothetical protein